MVTNKGSKLACGLVQHVLLHALQVFSNNGLAALCKPCMLQKIAD